MGGVEGCAIRRSGPLWHTDRGSGVGWELQRMATQPTKKRRCSVHHALDAT